MDRRRQFDAVGSDGAGEVEPFLDGEIGVGIPAIAWRQLLEGGGEYADRHVHGLEWLGWHGKLLRLDGLRMGGDHDGLMVTGWWVRADSIAAWRTRWVLRASSKSGIGTTGVLPPIIVSMSATWLTKLCS